MSEIVLLGQALIDYFCLAYFKDLEKLGIRGNGGQRRSLNDMDTLLDNSEIRRRDIGGCVTNTAFGINALNGSASLHYVIGNDLRGSMFVQGTAELKNIQNCPQCVEGSTGAVITYIDRDNPEKWVGIFNHGVANTLSLDESLRKKAQDSISYISLFSFFEKDSSNLFEILKYFKDHGSRIILDGGGLPKIDSAKLTEIISFAEGLLLNEHESRVLEGLSSTPRIPWKVIKNGKSAIKFYENEKLSFEIPIEPSLSIVNSLGAGDAFAAAFLKSLSDNQGYYSSILRGHNYAQGVLNSLGAH